MNEEFREACKEGFRKLIAMEKAFFRFEVFYQKQKFIGNMAYLYGKAYKIIYKVTKKGNRKLFNLCMSNYKKFFAMDAEHQEKMQEWDMAIENMRKQNEYLRYLAAQLTEVY